MIYENDFYQAEDGIRDWLVTGVQTCALPISNLYSEATAFIFPSLYEGFGLPLLEAMACGCPTISSNMASLPEIGGKAAHFFDPTEISDMAEAIRKVCEDSAYQQKLAQGGLKHAKQFNLESSVKQHVDLFETILN